MGWLQRRYPSDIQYTRRRLGDSWRGYCWCLSRIFFLQSAQYFILEDGRYLRSLYCPGASDRKVGKFYQSRSIWSTNRPALGDYGKWGESAPNISLWIDMECICIFIFDRIWSQKKIWRRTFISLCDSIFGSKIFYRGSANRQFDDRAISGGSNRKFVCYCDSAIF